MKVLIVRAIYRGVMDISAFYNSQEFSAELKADAHVFETLETM